MGREVTDKDGTTWMCVQAFSGVSDSTKNKDAAEVKGEPGSYWVVCTPTGGAQSVRLKLDDEWETTYSDEELINEIKAQQ